MKEGRRLPRFDPWPNGGRDRFDRQLIFFPSFRVPFRCIPHGGDGEQCEDSRQGQWVDNNVSR